MKKIKEFTFEVVAIFIGVLAAFALTSWNENRKDHYVEQKVLSEIRNGLKQDIRDLNVNLQGHEDGLAAAKYFRNLFSGREVVLDSIHVYHFNLLRDFVSIQNISGYETLKSRGLEIIRNDSLRLKIISLYELDYNTLQKLEEEYEELQFYKNYSHLFSEVLANGGLDPFAAVPAKLQVKVPQSQRNTLMLALWRMTVNRRFVLEQYHDVIAHVEALREQIEEELKN